jgi:hypothetical protein
VISIPPVFIRPITPASPLDVSYSWPPSLLSIHSDRNGPSVPFYNHHPLCFHIDTRPCSRNSIALISLQNNGGWPLPFGKTQVTHSKQFNFSLGALTPAETVRRPVHAAICAIVFARRAGCLDSVAAAVGNQMSTGFQCAGCGEWNETSVDAAAGVKQTYVEDCQVCCKPNVLHATWDRETGEYEIQAELE